MLRVVRPADRRSDLRRRHDRYLVDRALRFFPQAVLGRRRHVDADLVGVLAQCRRQRADDDRRQGVEKIA